MMLLSHYISALGEILVSPVPDEDPEISSVFNRASDVRKGTLFCAIRGAKADGHDFLPEALANGASAICVSAEYDGPLPGRLPVLRVSDSYRAWGILCEEFSGRPADAFRVHTVTGTNGKTTIAYILRDLLTRAGGRKTALLTTVLCDVCDGNPRPSAVTMPDAAAIQKIFTEIRSSGATDAVMESSSHGLHQHRTGSLAFASAVFTNLTGDHLDYHGTMENYYLAKRSLFREMLAPDAPAVINIADSYGKRLFEELRTSPVRRLSFDLRNPRAYCSLDFFRPTDHGSHLEFTLDGRARVLESPLRGEHNAFNLLETIACGVALGLDADRLLDAARTVPPAPGRLESFRMPSGALAFVDYAHTDDALRRVLESLRGIRRDGGRILTVFGCGGDRDRTKRPRMGGVVAELSDIRIVTSDNPRSEDPRAIIREIEAGMPSGTVHEVEPDRAAAIARAVELAEKNDMILLAGKGHETTQEILGVKHPFDDRAVLCGLGGKKA